MKQWQDKYVTEGTSPCHILADRLSDIERNDELLGSHLSDMELFFPVSNEILSLNATGHFFINSGVHLTHRVLDSYLLVQVFSGDFELHCGRETFRLKGGQCIWIDCHDPVYLLALRACEIKFVYFNGSPASYYYSRYLETTPGRVRDCNEHLRAAFTRIPAGKSNTTDIENSLRLTTLITGMITFGSLASLEESIPPWLQSVKKKLETEYETELCLDRIADEFHINKYQLCRDFNRYMQISPMKYLTIIRIEHAKDYLTGSRLKVHEISEKVGFDNVNTFIRSFKKVIGVTPSSYRKNHGGQ